eukprot:TRINITY_DN303_c0_g1_i1.p1 TRINITY_DN303_c0_g1~~TRINITY_DN303_c0_g1_i1.p1  ORF type:complete len:621 (+),score=211.52 TRINITY_DN303_c0_g1_i1:83-1864(+)
MLVTRSSFSESTRERVLPAIDRADFVAFDLEFSGLEVASSRDHLKGAPPASHYEALRDAARQFVAMQLGLACFRVTGDGLAVEAFSFPTFPAPFDSERHGAPLSFQADTFDFLRKNGFDFNQWIQEGVPHITREQEESVRARIAEQRRAAEEMEAAFRDGVQEPAAPDERGPPQRILEQIDGWYVDRKQGVGPEELSLGKMYGRMRRSVMRSVKQTYPDPLPDGTRVWVESNEDGDTYVRMLEESAILGRLRADVDASERRLWDFIGVRHVFEALSRRRIPIVAHNAFLDLLHAWQRYVRPLPDSADDFTAQLSEAFPVIVDVKYVAKNHPEVAKLVRGAQGESTVAALYKLVEGMRPAVDLPPDVRQQAHDASWDAIMTGTTYARLAMHAGVPLSLLGAPAETALSSHINKIFLFNSMVWFSTSGPQPVLDDGRYWRVAINPGHDLEAIRGVFRPAGRSYISFVNSRTCVLDFGEGKSVTVMPPQVHKNAKLKGMKFTRGVQEPRSPSPPAADSPAAAAERSAAAAAPAPSGDAAPTAVKAAPAAAEPPRLPRHVVAPVGLLGSVLLVYTNGIPIVGALVLVVWWALLSFFA